MSALCPPTHLTFDLHSADETAAFAALLSAQLNPGDTLLLSGPVGAGKTHFARALVKSLLIDDEDVPSPTFTLVQTYDTRKGALWHADLYRLTSTSEIEELGLIDAMQDAICIIEWPDRLGADMPRDGLDLGFEPLNDINARHLVVQFTDPKWAAALRDWPTKAPLT